MCCQFAFARIHQQVGQDPAAEFVRDTTSSVRIKYPTSNWHLAQFRTRKPQTLFAFALFVGV